MEAGWLFLVLTAGMALVVNVLWRVGERMMGVHRAPKEMEGWVEEVRKVLFSLVDCEIDKHNLEARLAHLLGSQPPEYDGLASEAFKRQLLLHPALAAKAEEVGLFPVGSFERMGVPNYQHFNPTAPLPQPQLRAVEAQPESKVVGTVKVPHEAVS